MAKKDLSSLKKKLAKKAGGDGPDAPDTRAAATSAAAAPGSFDIPAPGETAPPPRQEAPAAPTHDAGRDPLGGGRAFDPTAGVIADSGSEATRSSGMGAIIGISVLAIVLGAGGGWVLAGATATSQALASGVKGGASSFEKVKALAEVRTRISDSIGSTKEAITTDPVAGSAALADLLTANFQDLPKVDQVYGWQLAALHPDDIDKTFQLYHDMGEVVVGLGLLAGFVIDNAKVLGGGPSKFGVVYRGEGAVLVELVDVLCNLETKTPCGADASAAQGYLIRESLGGPEAVVPKDQAAPLVANTPIYAYAIGEAPAENAKKEYERLGANLDEKLASMGALETEVITAFERFAQAPTVDDGSVQPDAQ